jgi:hypothetical protein
VVGRSLLVRSECVMREAPAMLACVFWAACETNPKLTPFFHNKSLNFNIESYQVLLLERTPSKRDAWLLWVFSESLVAWRCI